MAESAPNLKRQRSGLGRSHPSLGSAQPHPTPPLLLAQTQPPGSRCPQLSLNDLQHWWHLTLANTNWNNTVNYISHLLYKRGYPTFITGYDQNTIGLQRVWVTLTVDGTNYVLDPAFKVSQPVSGFNLASIMGVNSNSLMSVAGAPTLPTT